MELQKIIKISFIFLSFSFQQLYSQDITGIVIDEDNKPLEYVSVALLQPADSLLVKYTSTDVDGKFVLPNIKAGTYLFQIYLMTYQANQQTIIVGEANLDLKTIKLTREVNQLNEVIISAIVPIKIKQDTTAFNTKAFKVRQDDNVEDLIKKLPGIEISTDGTVSAQGEEVTKILVDGKEFFTNDMTIALKNLNADAIKTVQIIDEESNEARTTGVKDGEKTRILNLVLKEGKKTGYFGKLAGGLGTNDRYTVNADINMFSKNTQLAVFGGLNNINNTGATVFQRDGSRGNTNSGLLTTGTAGANFNYEIRKDYDFNIDYHYGYSDNEQEEVTNRTDYTNTSSFSSIDTVASNNISNNHNVNFSLRNRSKDGVYIEFRGNFKNDKRESDSDNNKTYFDENGNEDTYSERITRSDDLRNNGGLKFSIDKKFNDNGRNLRFRSEVSFRDNDDENYQISDNKYNISDLPNSYEEIEITKREEKTDDINYEFSLRYMEPIVKNHLVYFSTEVDNTIEGDDVNQSRIINSVEQDPLIYQLDYNEQVYNNQLGYAFSKDKIQIYASGAIETTKQVLTEASSPEEVNNTYNNFLPRATFSYEYKKGKKIYSRYRKEINLPSANQITPIVNDFNPLRIYMGNANLTPEISNQVFVMYRNNDFKTTTNFFSYLNFSKINNAIVVSNSFDENYVQTSTFENYGSRTSFRGTFGYGSKIKKIPLRYNARLSGNIDDYTTIIDDEPSQTKTKGTSLNLSLSNDNKNNFDVIVGAKFDINKTTYSINNDDRDFFQQNYYTKFEWDITSSINFNTQFDYTLYTDSQFDSQDLPIWNMAVEYAFLKGKRGNLKLQLIDILDKSVGIEKNSSANYYEETFKRSLGTYALLSFTYSLKPPTGKESKRGGSDDRRHHGPH